MKCDHKKLDVEKIMDYLLFVGLLTFIFFAGAGFGGSMMKKNAEEDGMIYYNKEWICVDEKLGCENCDSAQNEERKTLDKGEKLW